MKAKSVGRWICGIAASYVSLALACSPPQPSQSPSVPGDLSAVLEWSTYLPKGCAARAVALDAAGNVYATGGCVFEQMPASFRGRFGGGPGDVAVFKLAPDGRILWSAIFGGPNEDYSYVIKLTESGGGLYVGGRAGDGFPTTAGAFSESFHGGTRAGPHLPADGFVLQLSAEGELLHSTLIGGSGNDIVRAIHLTPEGKLVIAGGNSQSSDLPTGRGTLPGPVLKPQRGGLQDSYVAVISGDLAALDFLTYFGPSDDHVIAGDETIRALAMDSQQNIWIGGTTSGTDLVPTLGAFTKQRGTSGTSSAFVAKLSRDGRQLLYFSWLGGSDGNDEIETEGVSDAAGNFFLAGGTTASDFETTADATQRKRLGSRDGMLVGVNDDGSLRLATLAGGVGEAEEVLFGPVVDDAGNLYASGRFGAGMATSAGASQPQSASPDSEDAGLLVFDPRGGLRHATYYGGSGIDIGRHVAVDAAGAVAVIAVETNSLDLPVLGVHASAKPSAFALAKFRLSAPAPAR